MICGVQCKMRMEGPLFITYSNYLNSDSTALNQTQLSAWSLVRSAQVTDHEAGPSFTLDTVLWKVWVRHGPEMLVFVFFPDSNLHCPHVRMVYSGSYWTAYVCLPFALLRSRVLTESTTPMHTFCITREPEPDPRDLKHFYLRRSSEIGVFVTLCIQSLQKKVCFAFCD